MCIFLSPLSVLLTVVGEHDLRCVVINLYQPRLIEVLLRVVRILLRKCDNITQQDAPPQK
jgi:hypothetical protein